MRKLSFLSGLKLCPNESMNRHNITSYCGNFTNNFVKCRFRFLTTKKKAHWQVFVCISAALEHHTDFLWPHLKNNCPPLIYWNNSMETSHTTKILNCELFELVNYSTDQQRNGIQTENLSNFGDILCKFVV